MRRYVILMVLVLGMLCIAGRPYITNRGDKNISTDYSHHKIHQGYSFRVVHHENSLATNDKILYLINTTSGGDRAHMNITLASSGESYLEVWDSPTVSFIGGAQISQNVNLASSVTAITVITNTPTVTDAGTHLQGLDLSAGAGRKVGGIWSVNEIILDTDKLYLINAISEAEGNDVTVEMNWYETDDAY